MPAPFPSKPLAWRAVTALSRLAGRPRLTRWLAVIFASELMAGANRRLLQARYRRVLAWKGEPAGPERLEALIRGLGAVYGEHMASLALMDEADPSFEPMDAPEAAVESALARGKGLILASAHFGDAARAMASAARLVPVTTAVLDDFLYRWLGRVGVKMITVGGAAVDVSRALAANEAVWLNVDIDYFEDERTLPLFGAPVRPPQAAARLAASSGAPVLPVFPVSRHGRWSLQADELLEPEDAELEKKLLACLERRVAAHPDHWWLFSDPWDLAKTRAEARRALRLVPVLTKLRRLFGAR